MPSLQFLLGKGTVNNFQLPLTALHPKPGGKIKSTSILYISLVAPAVLKRSFLILLSKYLRISLLSCSGQFKGSKKSWPPQNVP
jgi:hypothetical protein